MLLRQANFHFTPRTCDSAQESFLQLMLALPCRCAHSFAAYSSHALSMAATAERTIGSYVLGQTIGSGLQGKYVLCGATGVFCVFGL